VRLAVLRHVDPDEGPLRREQPLASALTSSVLPTPVGPRNRKVPSGRSPSASPDARAAHRVGHGLDRGLLPDDAPVEILLEPEQPLVLAGDQLADRDARARRDHRGDVGLPDHGAVALRCVGGLAELGQAGLELVDLGLQPGRLLVVLGVHRGLLGRGGLGQPGAQPARLAARGDAPQAHPRGGLVDQIDRLVGQPVLRDVAVREPGGGLERGVVDGSVVVVLVARAQAVQDGDRLLDGRLLDHHR
jgi:hypothetical protein